LDNSCGSGSENGNTSVDNVVGESNNEGFSCNYGAATVVNSMVDVQKINLKEMSEKDQRGNNKEVQQQNRNKGKENAIEAAQSPLVVIREQDMDLEHEINA